MKRIYLFQTTHLPEDGWLQGCIICSEITGTIKRIKKYKLPLYQLCNNNIRNKERYGFMCHKCLRFQKKEFYKSCIKSIDNYIN